jgi:hypothetical protein
LCGGEKVAAIIVAIVVLEAMVVAWCMVTMGAVCVCVCVCRCACISLTDRRVKVDKRVKIDVIIRAVRE